MGGQAACDRGSRVPALVALLTGVLTATAALSADYALGRAVTGGARVISAAELARTPLSGGDRILLPCRAVLGAVRIKTVGSGVVRVEPAQRCNAGERPRFDGRESVSAVHRVAAHRWYAQSTDEVTQVFAHDNPVPRARHPATGYVLLNQPVDGHLSQLPSDPRWNNLNLAGAAVHARTQEWWMERRLVQADGRSFSEPLRYPLRHRTGVFFTGMDWMLGAGPGWAYDHLRQRLTVEGADPAHVQIVPAQALLQIHGTASVAVRGIDLVASGGDALTVRSAGEVDISDVNIRHAAGNGIAVAGARSARVAGVTVASTGADGIFFAEVALAEVLDSRVSDAGRLHGPGPALAAVNAHRTNAAKIQRNTIERSGYIGIRVGGDAVVTSNRVVDSCLSLSDCAAIYTWRRGPDDVRAPVRIESNFVLRVSGDTSVKTSVNDYFGGVYLDEWTRHAEVRGNVLVDVGQGVYMHNSFANTAEGNLVLGARHVDTLDAVDERVRAALASARPEVPNRWLPMALERGEAARWLVVPTRDQASASRGSAQVVVLEGPAADASLWRGCRQLLPRDGAEVLPVLVLRCSER